MIVTSFSTAICTCVMSVIISLPWSNISVRITFVSIVNWYIRLEALVRIRLLSVTLLPRVDLTRR